MKRFQTSIKPLMQAQKQYKDENGNKAIFLSDWDSDYKSIKIPNMIYNNCDELKLQKYYFWTDECNYKENIQNFFSSQFHHNLSMDTFTIGSNGTSCIMLSLMALKELGKQCALIITPIYFSTLNLLDELDFNVVQFRLSNKNNFEIDSNELEKVIMNNKIDVLIITNPIFGTGVELSIDSINEIVSVCNKYDISIIMDYIYGGLIWDEKNCNNYIFNYPVYKAVSMANSYVFIESISKKIFLNGTKIALIFSTTNIMRRILRLSVFMVGSMSVHQVNLVPQIYSASPSMVLNNLILDNAKTCYERFKLIKTILLNTSIDISQPNCGYFALASIPKKYSVDDTEYAIMLLKKYGVLTTPHSRYLYEESGKFSFRVNLLLDKNQLIDGIIKIRDLL